MSGPYPTHLGGPTNDVLAADSHFKVGLGRSYRDVPPIRGIYHGTAEEPIAVVETVVAEV